MKTLGRHLEHLTLGSCGGGCSEEIGGGLQGGVTETVLQCRNLQL